jgi:small-conductance mechanosensitive channel
LVEELVKPTTDCPKTLKKIQKYLDNTKDIPEALEAIDDLRRSLYEIDLRLEDCHQILRGYQKALVSDEDESETQQAFEQYEQDPGPNNQLQEQFKAQIADKLMKEGMSQMDDMNKSYEATKATIDAAREQAMEGMSPEMRSQMDQAGGGQAAVIKSMMDKMMQGQAGFPIGDKTDK